MKNSKIEVHTSGAAFGPRLLAAPLTPFTLQGVPPSGLLPSLASLGATVTCGLPSFGSLGTTLLGTHALSNAARYCPTVRCQSCPLTTLPTRKLGISGWVTTWLTWQLRL